MNIRAHIDKTAVQITNSHENKLFLAKNGIDYGVLEVTQTGLDKSILDAVASLRIYLREENYHNYNIQGQGNDSKIIKDCFISLDSEGIATQVSLYRPNTKQGDPRIWVYKLRQYALSGDEIAFIVFRKKLYIFNLSNIQLQSNITIAKIIAGRNEISYELLSALKELKDKGPLRSIKKGDTAIGMTIEHALGISPNSSNKPDYKGIELKSARQNRRSSNRSTLFALVPDWSLSVVKSSRELVEKYGYSDTNDPNILRLYCTIQAYQSNPQGLSFFIDQDADILLERHVQDGDIACWPGVRLRQKLIEKHKETFWIKANSINIKGEEYFDLISVTHTQNPLATQFLQLIEKRIITMDHLIKKKPKENAKEKGPLFKIHPNNIGLLFPEPKEYNLC